MIKLIIFIFLNNNAMFQGIFSSNIEEVNKKIEEKINNQTEKLQITINTQNETITTLTENLKTSNETIATLIKKTNSLEQIIPLQQKNITRQKGILKEFASEKEDKVIFELLLETQRFISFQKTNQLSDPPEQMKEMKNKLKTFFESKINSNAPDNAVNHNNTTVINTPPENKTVYSTAINILEKKKMNELEALFILTAVYNIEKAKLFTEVLNIYNLPFFNLIKNFCLKNSDDLNFTNEEFYQFLLISNDSNNKTIQCLNSELKHIADQNILTITFYPLFYLFFKVPILCDIAKFYILSEPLKKINELANETLKNSNQNLKNEINLMDFILLIYIRNYNTFKVDWTHTITTRLYSFIPRVIAVAFIISIPALVLKTSIFFFIELYQFIWNFLSLIFQGNNFLYSFIFTWNDYHSLIANFDLFNVSYIIPKDGL